MVEAYLADSTITCDDALRVEEKSVSEVVLGARNRRPKLRCRRRWGQTFRLWTAPGAAILCIPFLGTREFEFLQACRAQGTNGDINQEGAGGFRSGKCGRREAGRSGQVADSDRRRGAQDKQLVMERSVRDCCGIGEAQLRRKVRNCFDTTAGTV